MGIRRNKYGAKSCSIDGIFFPSQGEARRYQELCLLQRAGEIADLKVHPAFPIIINEQKIGNYVADFEYMEAGCKIVEDFKGKETDLFKWKRKLFEAIYRQPLRISGRSRRQS